MKEWEQAFREFAEEARYLVYGPAVLEHPHYRKAMDLAARARAILRRRVDTEEEKLMGLVEELLNLTDAWLQEAAFLAGFATALKLTRVLADPTRAIFSPSTPAILEGLETRLEELKTQLAGLEKNLAETQPGEKPAD